LTLGVFPFNFQTGGLDAILDTLPLFLHLQTFGAFREFEQADEFSNSYRCKTYVAGRVQLVAVANVDLLEIAHDNLAPPAIPCFPFESQMPLCRNIHLCDEIDIKLKRVGLIMKEAGLLFSADKELLCSRSRHDAQKNRRVVKTRFFMNGMNAIIVPHTAS